MKRTDDLNAPIELPTDRPGVVLRTLATPEDDQAYFLAVEASRTDLSLAGATAAQYQTVEDVMQARLDAKHKIRMGIWDGETFVGTVNATIDEQNEAEIGYWTDSRHTGRGYATLGARALSAYMARYCPRVFAGVVEGNEASMTVLERSGFTKTASHAGYVIFEYGISGEQH